MFMYMGCEHGHLTVHAWDNEGLQKTMLLDVSMRGTAGASQPAQQKSLLLTQTSNPSYIIESGLLDVMLRSPRVNHSKVSVWSKVMMVCPKRTVHKLKALQERGK